MIGTTTAIARAIESDSRRWDLILTDGSSNTLSSANGDIHSMNYTIETTNESLTIGDLITQLMNLELRRESVGQFALHKYAEFKAALKIVGLPTTIPLGLFRVTEAAYEQDKVRVTAKDPFGIDLDEKYNTNLTYPAKLKDVIEELANGYGVQLYEKLYILKDDTPSTYDDAYDKADSRLYVKSDRDDLIIESPIKAGTQGEALSICAAYGGFFLTAGRDGKLTGVMPSQVPCRIGLDRMSEPRFYGTRTIERLKCIVDDETTLYAGGSDDTPSENVMTFSCSAMTQHRLNMIAADYLELSYSAALIEHRLGDPRLDPLDMIGFDSLYEESEEGFVMPLTAISYTFDGGLSSTLSTGNK